MDFEKIVEVYEELEQVSSGNKMREILSEFFKEIKKEDVATLSYLMLGRLASEYESVVLGLAEKLIIKAIASAAGVSTKKVKESVDKTGDAGLTAEQFLQKKPITLIPLGKLTVEDFFKTLHKISTISGTGSQDQKSNQLVSMYQKSSAKGAKYITRIALGTLRLGVGDMTVLDSLAIAFTGDKTNKKVLETAYNICPDVGVIAETLIDKGLKGLEKIDVHVGRPIKMMLGQRVKSLEEAQQKIPGEVTIEAKYDGERIQAHRNKKGEISLFSRRLDNITSQFPDLVEYLDKAISEKEFIVEGEVIAVDKDGTPLPFQTLMQRRRKYDIEEYIKKIPVNLKVFDLLYLNGESYLDEPYFKRSKKLEEIVHKNKNIKLTERIITSDVVEIDKFFKKMLEAGYEGIFIKSRAEDSVYQAGVRGWNWIKWKKEYVKDMVDTFDLVVVGAFFGRGRRSGTYGALLCACYNEEEDIFETVCKLGTGLTDEMLAELPTKLKEYKIDKRPARLLIKKEMTPDVWFTPSVVVEVLAAEITKSPYHALGLALRFPRFIRFREEKKAEQATTSSEIREMF